MYAIIFVMSKSSAQLGGCRFLRSVGRSCVCLFARSLAFFSSHLFCFALHWDTPHTLYNVAIVITFHMQFWICLFCLMYFFVFALYFRDTESLLHSIWWFICKFVSSIFILCSWCSILHSPFRCFVRSDLLFSYKFIYATIDCCTYRRPYSIVCHIYQLFCCLFLSCNGWHGKKSGMEGID